MKRTTNILIASLAILLVAVAFVTSKASASTGCFTDTNGHWAETFICWMKDNGISAGYVDGTFRPENAISRAELAVLLGRMRSTGVAQINSGAPNEWNINGTPGNSYIDNYSNLARVGTSVAGTYGFQMAADLPSSLYNSRMLINAAKLCYETPNGAYITSVTVSHRLTNGNVWRSVTDTTDLTGNTCTTFSITDPGTFFGGEYGTVFIQITFPANSDYVDLLSTTFYLTPSIDSAVGKESREEFDASIDAPVDEGAAP